MDKDELIATIAENQVGLAREITNMHKSHLALEKSRRFWEKVRIGLLAIPTFVFLGIVGYQVFKVMEPDIAGDYVAVVNLKGMISSSSPSNAKAMNKALSKAFSDKKAKGVILRVNSPGGTPVQSGLVRDHIDFLRTKYPEKRYVVVAEDVIASGAYLISSSADMIYAHPSTIAGSIGVIMQNWTIDDALEKIGVNKWTIASGIHKNRFSPFDELTSEEIEKGRLTTRELHQQFANYVTKGRGDRLVGKPEVVLSGDFWLAPEAKELGVIDDYGSIEFVMAKEFDTEKAKNYGPGARMLDKLAEVSLSSIFNALHEPAFY